MNKLLIILMLICINVTIAHSQNFYKDTIIPKNGVQISGGPSFIYANNSGSVRSLGFKLLPSFSLAYSRQLNPYLSMRGTSGVQLLKSNMNLTDEVKGKWGKQDKAYGFQGQAVYADIMPMLQMFPTRHQGATFNVYTGVGLGLMYVNSIQNRMIDHQPIARKARITTGYAPVRIALGKKINEKIEFLIEGTFMATLSDNLDGHVGKKYIQNDHLLQGQLAIKKLL